MRMLITIGYVQSAKFG